MAKSTRSTTKLSPARIKSLKAMARRIDAEEAADIKSRGRAAFDRHERVRAIVLALKHERQRQGLSLADLARRTGIAKPNLSRIESNPHAAPTLDTLDRYARAIGKTVRVELADAA